MRDIPDRDLIVEVLLSTGLEEIKFAAETTKELMALTTGLLGLSATFAKDLVEEGKPRGALFAAWVVLVVSLGAGMLVIMALTGSLADGSASAQTLLARRVVIPGMCQFVLFGIGVVLLVVYAALKPSKVRGGPKKRTTIVL